MLGLFAGERPLLPSRSTPSCLAGTPAAAGMAHSKASLLPSLWPAVILIWEDVWDLNNSAALTGWLLSLITAGAVITGVLLPKRFW